MNKMIIKLLIMEEVLLEHLQFKHPFTALAAGPTGSGKTVLIRRILSNHKWTIANINEPKLRVIWMYGVWQSQYGTAIDDSVDVQYMAALPSTEDIELLKPHLIVIDDMMSEMASSKEMSDWFSKYSHHNNISVLFVVQNLFFQSKLMRTISLNAQYMILLKNARDRNQIAHLGRQLYPNNPKFLINVFSEATNLPYGYLIVDATATTPDKFRLRRRITKEEVIHLNTQFRPLVYKP